jgi:hypothetical protein
MGEVSSGRLRPAPTEVTSRAMCWDNGLPLGLNIEGDGDEGEIDCNGRMILGVGRVVHRFGGTQMAPS